MNKKAVIIGIAGTMALIAIAIVWLYLRPTLKSQHEDGQVYNDAWKLERIQGAWASDDGVFAMEIDGYDFVLKINGVYALAASCRFDGVEQPQDGDARFALALDPDSMIYPDEIGAKLYPLQELWYENDAIYIRFFPLAGAVEGETACLLRTEAVRPGWA